MLSFRNSSKQLSDSGVDTAIISVGSTEQCGPCLPLHLDTLIAEYFARAFGERLSAYGGTKMKSPRPVSKCSDPSRSASR